MRIIGPVLLLAGALIASSGALAQPFPGRSVALVIPFTPGGANDVLGRYLADGLSKLWKQPTVVENRGGAGGSIGAAYVAKSKPDGYTLLFMSGSYTINAAVQKSLPFDPLKDLKPVSMAMRGEMILVTGSRVPMPSVAELVKQAKEQKIFFGANGANLSTFAGALFNNVAGVKMQEVNYKGGAETLVDMAGGRLDVFFATVPTLLASINNKTVVPIAVTSRTRSKTLPDVPTIVEAGYPEGVAEQWWGVFAPTGTPPEIIQKINGDIKTVLNTPEAEAFLGKQGAAPAFTTVDEFGKLVATEMDRWRELAKAHNITAE